MILTTAANESMTLEEINFLLKTERMFAIIKIQPKVNTRLKNIIFHIDVNSAFLSWEAVYRLAHKGGRQDLREIPSPSTLMQSFTL